MNWINVQYPRNRETGSALHPSSTLNGANSWTMHKQTIAWLRTASARAGVVPQTGSAPRATDSPLCRTGRCRATAAGCRRGKLRAQISAHGWVAEWLKAPVLKTGEAATSPWVRIPPHPPTGDTAPRGWFTRQALRQTPGALPLDQHEIIAREVGLEHALQRYGIVGVELDQRTASGVGRCRLHGGEVGKAEGRDVEDIPRARAGRKVGDDVVFASVAEQVVTCSRICIRLECCGVHGFVHLGQGCILDR